jgi:hypothetical protein
MTVVLVVVAVAQMQVPRVQEELEAEVLSQLPSKLEACYLLLLPVLQISAVPSVLSPGVAWSWQLVVASASAVLAVALAEETRPKVLLFGHQTSHNYCCRCHCCCPLHLS